MSASAPLICLLTPGHVASTPRLVKEADALVDAGYRVHVVAGRHFERPTRSTTTSLVRPAGSARESTTGEERERWSARY